MEDQKKNESLYMFFEKDEGDYIVYVYALESTSLSLSFVTKLPRGESRRMGYLAHGSKLYALGGEDPVSGNWGFPREVFVCDLTTTTTTTTTTSSEWKKMASGLNAGKPSPMVVAVRDKIYALAGISPGEVREQDWEVIDSPFEVLDPTIVDSAWSPLPRPPFYSWYIDPPGPTLVSHTLVDDTTIYVVVRNPRPQDPFCSWKDEESYSFNVDENRWLHHPRLAGDADGVDGTPTTSVLNNLRWYKRADAAKGKLYLCNVGFGNCLDICRYDLMTTGRKHLPKKKTKKITKKKTKKTTTTSTSTPYGVKDGDRLNWEVSSGFVDNGHQVSRIVLPVRGFKFINPDSENDFLLTQFGCCGRETIVTHLENHMLLVVCVYYLPPSFPDRGRFVYSCLLKLREAAPNTKGRRSSRGCAVMVKHKYFKISHRLNSIKAWSTM